MDHHYETNYSVSRNLTNSAPVVAIDGTIVAKIYGGDDDEFDEKETVAGTVSAQRIDYWTLSRKRIDPTWAADEYGSDLCHVAEALYGNGESGWHPKIEKFLADIELCFATDVLYLDKMEIEKEHRGISLGLHVARETIEMFCKDRALVICHPYPMDVKRGDDNRVLDEEKLKVGHKKLRAYWERLGFVNLPGTDYWVFSSAYDVPDIPAIGG